MTNRKAQLCVVAKLDLVTGTVQGHPDGFGFLVPDDGSADLFLSPKEMHKALHGDRVTARQIGIDKRGRPEGVIVDVLARVNHEVVGRVYEDHGIWYLVAENKRISQDILIPPDMRGKAKPGQVVIAELMEQPSVQREAMADLQVLASTHPGMEIEIALRCFDLPPVLDRSQAPGDAPAHYGSGRRSQGSYGPDPISAGNDRRRNRQDFDDPCTASEAQDFRLIVAIADVSHYVRDGDAIDREARERGTSCISAACFRCAGRALQRVMLVKPAVDRLCVVCDMSVSGQGTSRAIAFTRGHALARPAHVRKFGTCCRARPQRGCQGAPHLENVFALYKALAAARARRGAIDFETIELELKFDTNGKIESIVPVVRNEAHKLIEECMLAANVCAAEYLLKQKHPALYRVHEGPTPEKLKALKEFLAHRHCPSAE
jgi:ribonuclease R